MFTDVTPDTVSMSTVVSADVGPVTAPGDIVTSHGSGTRGGGVFLRGQCSDLQLTLGTPGCSLK